MERWPLTG